MPGTGGGKTTLIIASAKAACGRALNSAVWRALLLAGMLPALAHSTALSSTYLMNRAEAASLHWSLPFLWTGRANSGPPPQIAGWSPICGGGPKPLLNETALPVTLGTCQMPFQIMPTEPALKALRPAFSSMVGSDHLLCASFLQVSALTPASLFQVAFIPSGLYSLPPYWCSSIWKIC